MNTIQSTADVEADNSTGNLSVEDYVRLEVEKAESQDPEVQNKNDQDVSNEADSTEQDTEGDESEVSEDVLSQSDESDESDESDSDSEGLQESEEIDFDSLTVGELANLPVEKLSEWSKNQDSNLVKRIGKLTARAKSAEEYAKALESKLATVGDQEEFERPVKDNPLSNLDTTEKIEQKQEQAEAIVEKMEDVLFDSEGYGPDDVVFSEGGVELTRSQVRNVLKNARKDLKTYIPAQKKAVQQKEKAIQLEEKFQQAANKELPWLAESEGNLRKTYDSWVSDSRLVESMDKMHPEVKAQMSYLLAHALNSINQQQLLVQEPEKKKPNAESIKRPKPTPPTVPSGNASPADKKESPKSKKIRLAKERFEKSKSSEDWINYQTLLETI